VLIRDYHIKGHAEKITDLLDKLYSVKGITKPNADLETITLSINLETENLIREDITIICGGTTVMLGGKEVTNRTSLSNKFGKKTESAYVITVDVPNQYNVRNSSGVNMEVTVFNMKMHKILKNFQPIQTQHNQGKKTLFCTQAAYKLGNKIIPVQWEDMKVKTATINYDNQHVQIPQEINSDMYGIEEVQFNLPQEQEQPQPTRQKKPANRSEDFFFFFSN
jgi:hypothetical protein